VAYWYQAEPHVPFAALPHYTQAWVRATGNFVSASPADSMYLRKVHSYMPFQDFNPTNCVALDLSSWANLSFTGTHACAAFAGLDSMPRGRRLWAGVPFQLAATSAAPGAVACALQGRDTPGLPAELTIPVHKPCSWIYLLCAAHLPSNTPPGTVCASVKASYDEHRWATQDIIDGEHVADWRFGRYDSLFQGKFAWMQRVSSNDVVALHAFRMENPLPDAPIESLTFSGTTNGPSFAIFAITLEDSTP
jgi:hypothetical protein